MLQEQQALWEQPEQPELQEQQALWEQPEQPERRGLPALPVPQPAQQEQQREPTKK